MQHKTTQELIELSRNHFAPLAMREKAKAELKRRETEKSKANAVIL